MLTDTVRRGWQMEQYRAGTCEPGRSEDSGPINSTQQLLDQGTQFEVLQPQAQSIREPVTTTLKRRKEVATSEKLGLQTHEFNDFTTAFESHIK